MKIFGLLVALLGVIILAVGTFSNGVNQIGETSVGIALMFLSLIIIGVNRFANQQRTGR